MRAVVWMLSLLAGACALGWVCGARWCDIGCVATVAFALLLGGEQGRAG